MAVRVLLMEAGSARDVFEVVAVDDSLVRVRSAFLFEIGEELSLAIERDDVRSEVLARVRAHSRDGETELEVVTP
jgi:hypothetical protein